VSAKLLLIVLVLAVSSLFISRSLSRFSASASSPSPADLALTPQFDPLSLKPGDQIGNLAILSISAATGNSISAADYSVIFSGRITVTGKYGSSLEGAFPDTVCFDSLDNDSLSLIPRFPSDIRTIRFCFDNQKLAQQLLGPIGKSGQAAITIDNYTINFAPTEIYNTATLIKVDHKY
jgi:hypothetical protein